MNEERKGVSMSMLMMNGVLGMIVVISWLAMGNGQSVPPCANQLSPCIDFMNSTNPPDTCCNPIKDVNATQKTCFCQLILTPGLLEGLGTTAHQALQLIQFCGVNFTITTCKTSQATPWAQPPSLVQPPAMLGGDEGSGASRPTFTGLSLTLFLIMCLRLL